MAKTDEEKARFMREHGATHATWSDDGQLLSLTLAPQPPAPARQPGPAERMAEFHARHAADRRQRQHEVLFAASSVRPKLDDTPPPNAVPRAVRAKEAAAARGSKEG